VISADGLRCEALITGLQSLFQEAVDDEVIAKNPFSRKGRLLDGGESIIEESAAGGDHRHPKPYTRPEQARLLNHLRVADFSLFVATRLALRAGLRRSEALGLRTTPGHGLPG
jgi:integrase